MGWVKSVKGKANLLLMVIGEIFISARFETPVARKIQSKFLENTFLFQDQYEFCYRVVQEYLDAVDIYDT